VTPEPTKRCYRCKSYKKLGLFYKDSSRKDGFFPICKRCDYLRKKDSPGYLEYHKRKQKRYRDKYPEKTKAHEQVAKAIASGSLIKLPCEICQNPISEAHHPDYNQPLLVRWLCKQHHLLADSQKI
jgi:hypothetical protein